MPPRSQGEGSCLAREREAGSLDGIEATVGRGKAKLKKMVLPLWTLRVMRKNITVNVSWRFLGLIFLTELTLFPYM